MRKHTLKIGVSLALAGALFALTGCAPQSIDEPPFKLGDNGSISQIDVVEQASEPSGYPGAGNFVYSMGVKGQDDGQLALYDLASGESSGSVGGVHPSLSSDVLYYYGHGSLMAIEANGTGEPVDIGVSGYTYVVASPGNRWLILGSPDSGTNPGRLAINDREQGVTTPLAWSEERQPANPSWVDDVSFVLDAVAPADSGADRAIYQLSASGTGEPTGTLLKLAAQMPAHNGQSWLACLEQVEGSASPALSVYDLDGRERIAVQQPATESTFGKLVWVAEDTLAVEVDTKDEGTSVVLYKVEG